MKNKWLDNFGKADNANESNVIMSEDFVGLGYNTKGRNYSPAWGGQFQKGGQLTPVSPFQQIQQAVQPTPTVPYLQTKDPREFYKSWIESPEYKQRLKATGYGDLPDKWLDGKDVGGVDYTKQQRLDLLENIQPFEYNKYKKSEAKPFDVGGPTININPLDYEGSARQSIEAHEIAHVGTPTMSYQESEIIRNAMLPMKEPVLSGVQGSKERDASRRDLEDFKHLQDPDEAKADLDALRFMMYDKGIYDITKGQKFTETDFEKAKQNLGKDRVFKRLTDRMGKKNFVNLMNTIASADQEEAPIAMGGMSIPGSVGFTYARTAGAAPSNGPYAKKTKASAQNGQEMKFYQNGLDWKPKSMQDGGEQDLVGKATKFVSEGISGPVTTAALALVNMIKPISNPEIYKTVRPVGYPNALKLPVHAYNYLMGNESEPLKTKSGKPHLAEEFWATAMGMPVEKQYLKESQYKPSKSKDPDAKYYTIRDVIDDYQLMSLTKDLNPGEKMEMNGLSPILDTKWYSQNATTDKGVNFDEIDPLQRYTLEKSPDGSYVSIYDKYDFNNPALNKMMNPIEIYDRFYLPKKKDGGIVKDNDGYLNPNNFGKVVEIDSNDITMEGVYEPLLGVSDTGDTKLMKPGKNYKFKGKKVTEYPVAQIGKNIPFKGAANINPKNPANPIREDFSPSLKEQEVDFPIDYNKDEVMMQKNWLNSYIESPKYAERLKKEFPGKTNEFIKNEINARLNNLSSAKLNYVNSIGESPGWIAGAYAPKKAQGETYDYSKKKWIPTPPASGKFKPGNVYLESEYKSDNFFPSRGFETIPLHEFGHAVDDGGSRIPDSTIRKIYNYTKDQYDYPSYKKGEMEFSYENTPSEFVNRIQPIRYLLNRANIYDAKSSDFTEEHYDRMIENMDIFQNEHYKDVMRRLGNDDDIKKKAFIDLMNTIAYKNDSTEIPVAKLGINQLDAQPMKKLNQLLNFTNNPDKDNWLDKYN